MRPEDRAVFRRIGEAESSPSHAPASFAESIATLSRLISRRRAMFPDRRFLPTDDEFDAHQRVYARAHELGVHRG